MIYKSSLEDTNQWYALAKISGLKLCETINFNLIMIIGHNANKSFGENDNYKGEYAHVIPAN